jgi:predicted AlkP superfamily phosphohydrolase/phosphomutase
MMSGRDPGELGIYGFRNRLDRSYNRMGIADGRAVKVPRLWDYLGEAGWTVSVISVPGTFPPPAVKGSLISCFLTPNVNVPFTYPESLGAEILTEMPEFMLDVPEFRSEDKAQILENIYRLCDQRFTLAERSLLQEKPDFLMLVDMGVDRIHHSFWKAMDPTHPDHEPDSPFAHAIHDYYCHLDRRIDHLLSQCSTDTAVLVVSDHGARALMGGFCLNEWLIEQGYLVLKEPPTGVQSLEDVAVDWSKTRVWGAGGYYGRIFFNVQGREPQGCIPVTEYDRLRQELAEKLQALRGPDGALWRNQIHIPQQTYQRVRGVAPDLLVYFDQLAWRSIGTVGHGALYTTGNDTGPDDANHAQYGLAIFYDPQNPQGGKQLENAQIYDILPTLLKHYGLPVPNTLRGKSLL